MSRSGDTSCRTRLYNCLANFFELYKTHKYFSLRGDIEIAKLDILIDWKEVAEIPAAIWLREPNFGRKTLHLLLEILAKKGLGPDPGLLPLKNPAPLRRLSQSTRDVARRLLQGEKARFISTGGGRGRWVIGPEKTNCTYAVVGLTSRGYLWITPWDKMSPLAGLNTIGREYFTTEGNISKEEANSANATL